MRWWSSVFSMELRKILAFRSEFWITFLGQTLIQLIIARALWQNIFASNGTQSMKGYDLETMTLYYLLVPVGMKILLGEAVGFISREVYDGSFSRYLIYPISFFQYKTITYMTHSLFYGLQIFLIFHVYHALFSHSIPSPLPFAQGLVLFMIAAFTFCMMSMCLELVSLWADNIWTLLVMLRFFTSFFGGGLIPLEFFPEWGQQLVMWTPFPYLMGVPVRTMMGMSEGSEQFITSAFLLLVWGMFFAGIAFVLWKKGEKNYTGVGI